MYKTIPFSIFLFLLLFPLVLTGQKNAFLKHSQERPVTIVFDSKDEKTVELAAEALARDIELLSGVKPAMAHHFENSGSHASSSAPFKAANSCSNCPDQEQSTSAKLRANGKLSPLNRLRTPSAPLKKRL
ncbi:hypothetical protein [Geofilum rubicundum]|uniref:Uncharacterized protein n=1 Tax=Geofilum rubicundum JCM 15548 TaxID=1236989 RepID=A0A0E9LV15_9BACT|nr:hypothetical protein [Geofilum rubicundum]GAO28956.1 hypothetical protein JCM15548_11103 [Geofilum rubicundum JCM 15548]